jgi:proline dehydrogenase
LAPSDFSRHPPFPFRMTADDRWALPDRSAALERCARRKGEHVRCAVDMLGGNARTASVAQEGLREHLELVQKLGEAAAGGSLAVKLSTLGAAFDRELCRRNLMALSGAGLERCVPIELDMEGRSLVDLTLRTALEAASTGLPVTQTLQAYLDRTPGDLEKALDGRLRVRLVKGAYLGDTADFVEIHKRMRNLCGRLLEAGGDFCVGTHDAELVGWLEQNGNRRRSEFGFLMGLADETKLRLASSGWRVVEYVPFGPESGPYIARRKRYLKELERIGRTPAP